MPPSSDLAGKSLKLQEARSKEAKKLADTGAWFDFTKVERFLGSKSISYRNGRRPDRNGFNKYDPASSTAISRPRPHTGRADQAGPLLLERR